MLVIKMVNMMLNILMSQSYLRGTPYQGIGNFFSQSFFSRQSSCGDIKNEARTAYATLRSLMVLRKP